MPAAGDVRSVDLGEVGAVDRAITRFGEAAGRPLSPDYRKRARELDALILEPLRPLIGEATRVFLSPDGALNLVPFSALVDESGRYAIERYSFNYLSSGRELLRVNEAPISRKGDGDWIVADPDFVSGRDGKKRVSDASSGLLSRALRGSGYAPLPGTAAEAAAVQEVLKEAEIVTGEKATESALKALEGPRLLHIATHGFFLQDQSQSHALERGAGDVKLGTLSARSGAGPPLENPLLLSGLVLAGANVRDGGGGEDGILTALEASGLDLAGTELVVLSACDTGIGEIRIGQGVFGLRRALALAGAESQVMTLWSVADLTTTDLMSSYYRRLKAGEGRAEALRGAQLELLAREDRSHPFFWASFIHSGDWRPLPIGR
jgi:CHAT domain-containing protein